MSKFCSNCGNELGENDKVCGNCGTPVGGSYTQTGFGSPVDDVINSVKDTTSEYNQEEIKSGMGMSILCYFGFLVLIPLFTEKSNQFVKFHVKQGLNAFIWTFIAGLCASFVSAMLPNLVGGLITSALSILTLVIEIIGIVNAAQGKAKELPIINKLPEIYHG